METLKPCPFCGHNKGKMISSMGEWWVYCENCDATTRMCMTKDGAAEVWNMRNENKENKA